MITIHIDFVNGTELSYVAGLCLVKEGKSFSTNCLTFFNNDIKDDVKVIDVHGRYILKSELMSNASDYYTSKEMRHSHNITKMLIANAFTWRQPKYNKDENGLYQVKNEVYYYKNHGIDIDDAYEKISVQQIYLNWLNNQFQYPCYEQSRVLLDAVGSVLKNNTVKLDKISNHIKVDCYLRNVLNKDITDML